jgi:hypothetical protein
LQGLAVIGSGDDPLSQAVAAGTSAAVEWSATEYPDQTAAVLGVLEATGNAIDATVTYVDDATGNEVSRRWNEIPEHTRNQIKGGAKIASIFVPAGSIKALKQLKTAKKLPDGPSISIGGKTCVYSCEVGGVTRYVGITDDVARRGREHLSQRGIVIERIEGLSNLSRADARAVEQVLINYHGLGRNGGTLLNRINSISSVRNPTAYEQSLVRGTELLRGANYPGFN